MKSWSPVVLSPLLMLAAGAVAGPELVSLPAQYRADFVHYDTRDRVAQKQVAELYASEQAVASARAGQPLASGSVLVMELYKAELDAAEMPKKDAAGRFIKGPLAAIVAMEKRAGWGGGYPEEIRNGEWEYAKFTAAGAATGDDTKACFECHKPLVGQDYLFTFDTLDSARP